MASGPRNAGGKREAALAALDRLAQKLDGGSGGPDGARCVALVYACLEKWDDAKLGPWGEAVAVRAWRQRMLIDPRTPHTAVFKVLLSDRDRREASQFGRALDYLKDHILSAEKVEDFVRSRGGIRHMLDQRNDPKNKYIRRLMRKDAANRTNSE